MYHKKLTVYIADDHTFVRKGMSRLLNTFKRIGEVQDAENGKDLIKLLKDKTPDIVILDVEMPVMGGIPTAKYLTKHYPGVKILVLTMHTEGKIIHELIEAGVHGFLTKDADPQEVEKALYAIVDKDYYVNTRVNKLLKSPHLPNSKQLDKPITPRQREILLLICKDYKPSEIAERLNITEKTYFIHRDHLIRKIDARTNVGILKFAIQNGYYKLEDS